MSLKLYLILVIALTLCGLAHTAVVGIDLGSEYVKIAAVQAGISPARSPLLMVTDHEANRKTRNSVFVSGNVTRFSEEARNQGVRLPENVFAYLKPYLTLPSLKAAEELHALLGNSFGFQQNETQENPSGEENTPSAAGSEVVLSVEETTLTVDEVMALFLQFTQDYVAESLNGVTRDAVLAVPTWYSPLQRQRLMDIATMSGYRPLGLISEPAAQAVSLALSGRQFPPGESYILIIDIGATAYSISLVEFNSDAVNPNAASAGNKQQKNQNQTILRVWDSVSRIGYGARHVDWLLAQYVGQQFAAAHPDLPNPLSLPKAQAKLLAAAQRTKEVLSANTVTKCQVESLVEGVDFELEVERGTLEELMAPMAAALEADLQQLLARHNGLVMSEVEVVGGGSRIPTLIQCMEKATGQALSRHIDGDEGAALGAAFFAATQSSSHRVQPLKVMDYNPVPVEVTMWQKEEEVLPSRPIFKAGDKLPSKKKVSQARNLPTAITIRDGQEGLDLLEYAVTPPNLDRYNLTDKPKLEATFALSAAGIPSLHKLEVVLSVMKKNVSSASASSSADSKENQTSSVPEDSQSDESKTDSEESNPTGEADGNETAAATDDSSEESSSPAAEDAEKDGESWYPTTVRKAVLFHEKRNILSRRYSERASIKSHIALLNKAETERKTRARALNSLEARIYLVRDHLDDDTWSIYISEEQQEALRELLSEAQDVVDFAEASDPVSLYDTTLKGINGIADSMETRKKEAEIRSEVQESMNKALGDLRNRSEGLSLFHAELKKVKDFNTTLQATEKWWMEVLITQEGLSPTSDPAFTAKESRDRLQKLESLAKDADGVVKKEQRRMLREMRKKMNANSDEDVAKILKNMKKNEEEGDAPTQEEEERGETATNNEETKVEEGSDSTDDTSSAGAEASEPEVQHEDL